jgi:hypothetical protein
MGDIELYDSVISSCEQASKHGTSKNPAASGGMGGGYGA